MHLLNLVRKTYFIAAVVLCMCWMSQNAQANVRVYPIEANKAGILIQSFTERGAPTLVFVYTSWCPVCRENFPSLLKIARDYKGKGLTILALSMDVDESALKRYLASYGDIPFTVYRIKQRHGGEFAEAVRRVGVNYQNSIPFSIIYGKSGKLLGQGNILVSSLEPVIAKLVEVKDGQKRQ